MELDISAISHYGFRDWKNLSGNLNPSRDRIDHVLAQTDSMVCHYYSASH